MAYLIGLSGGSGSGKTFVSKAILERLGDQVNVISFDNYYKDQSHLPPEERDSLNFDSPTMLDFDLFIEHLKLIKQDKEVDIPQYDFKTHTRKPYTVRFVPKKIVIVEGIMVLRLPVEMFDYKIYVDADSDIRLSRRIIRDVAERGRNPYSVIDQYIKTVKPMHTKYVHPCKHIADFIFKNNGNSGLNEQTLNRLIDELEILTK